VWVDSALPLALTFTAAADPAQATDPGCAAAFADSSCTRAAGSQPAFADCSCTTAFADSSCTRAAGSQPAFADSSRAAAFADPGDPAQASDPGRTTTAFTDPGRTTTAFTDPGRAAGFAAGSRATAQATDPPGPFSEAAHALAAFAHGPGPSADAAPGSFQLVDESGELWAADACVCPLGNLTTDAPVPAGSDEAAAGHHTGGDPTPHRGLHAADRGDRTGRTGRTDRADGADRNASATGSDTPGDTTTGRDFASYRCFGRSTGGESRCGSLGHSAGRDFACGRCFRPTTAPGRCVTPPGHDPTSAQAKTGGDPPRGLRPCPSALGQRLGVRGQEQGRRD